MKDGQAFIVAVAVAATVMQATFLITTRSPLSGDTLVLAVLGWVFACLMIALASFVPCALTTWLADQHPGACFFLDVGTAFCTAILWTVLGALWMTEPNGEANQITLGAALLRYLGWTIPSGLAGGFCFWALAHRPTRLG